MPETVVSEKGSFSPLDKIDMRLRIYTTFSIAKGKFNYSFIVGVLSKHRFGRIIFSNIFRNIIFRRYPFRLHIS